MAYSKQNFQDGQILTAANLEKMENGIIAGQGVRNLLVNSNFRNPINTNGQTSYTGAVEGIDKWVGGTSDSKVYINTAKSVAFYTNTVGNLAYFRQYINIPASHLYGKTFTLALEDAYGTIFVGTGTYLTENPSSTKSIIWITMAADRTFVLYMKTDGNAFVQLSTKDNTTTIRWAALYEGSYTVDTLPSYVPKPIQQEMLDCGVPLYPKNLLNNSDFRNPVNQRGQSSYSGSSIYCIDRWKISSTLSIVSDGVSFSSTNSSSNVLSQYVDYRLNGTYTFAAKVNGEVKTRVVSISSGTVTTIDNSNAAYTGGYLAFDYSSATDTYQAQIRANSGGYTVKASWAALYEGSYTADTLPPYVPKGYAAELMECQRYYENSWFGENKAINLKEMHGVAYKSDALDVSIKYRVPKRIMATVTLYPVEDTDGWMIYKNQMFIYLNSATAKYKYRDGFLLYATKGSDDTTTWVDGQAMLVYGHWEASADL